MRLHLDSSERLTAIRGALGGRLLPFLLIGVVSAGFLFAIAFDADAQLVIGVLIVGAVTALIECSADHRKR